MSWYIVSCQIIKPSGSDLLVGSFSFHLPIFFLFLQMRMMENNRRKKGRSIGISPEGISYIFLSTIFIFISLKLRKEGPASVPSSGLLDGSAALTWDGRPRYAPKTQGHVKEWEGVRAACRVSPSHFAKTGHCSTQPPTAPPPYPASPLNAAAATPDMLRNQKATWAVKNQRKTCPHPPHLCDSQWHFCPVVDPLASKLQNNRPDQKSFLTLLSMIHFAGHFCEPFNPFDRNGWPDARIHNGQSITADVR